MDKKIRTETIGRELIVSALILNDFKVRKLDKYILAEKGECKYAISLSNRLLTKNSKSKESSTVHLISKKVEKLEEILKENHLDDIYQIALGFAVFQYSSKFADIAIIPISEWETKSEKGSVITKTYSKSGLKYFYDYSKPFDKIKDTSILHVQVSISNI